MAREDVNIKVTANVAEAIQLWKAMEAGPDGMAKALDGMGKKGKESTKSLGDELTGYIGKWASGLAAVSAVTHHWTAQGIPTLIVSEEMSALALGKRALQFASNVPQEHWSHSTNELERDLSDFASSRAACIISEPCVTPKAVMESIERNIGEHGIRAVAIDYAQLLRGEGRSRYEQVSFVSNRLREAASRYNVLLLTLAQLNREVEKRAKFIPSVADIRDAGTLEQDADVILLLAWPHMVDPKQPPNQYQIFVAKNRNRPINQQLVVCRFDPSRQMISEATAREMPNYRAEFEEFEAEREALANEPEASPW